MGQSHIDLPEWFQETLAALPAGETISTPEGEIRPRDGEAVTHHGHHRVYWLRTLSGRCAPVPDAATCVHASTGVEGFASGFRTGVLYWEQPGKLKNPGTLRISEKAAVFEECSAEEEYPVPDSPHLLRQLYHNPKFRSLVADINFAHVAYGNLLNNFVHDEHYLGGAGAMIDAGDLIAKTRNVGENPRAWEHGSFESSFTATSEERTALEEEFLTLIRELGWRPVDHRDVERIRADIAAFEDARVGAGSSA